MPGFDKTGPIGRGPATGRGFGPCGFGLGLGWRRRFATKKDQKQVLADYQKALQAELEDVKKEQEELK